jgi:hypothetical protein
MAALAASFLVPLLGGLLGPTLNRVGTKIDRELAPHSYGDGKKKRRVVGGSKSCKKHSLYVPGYKMSKRSKQGFGMYNRKHSAGSIINYGPLAGYKRKGGVEVVSRDSIPSGANP